LLFRTSSRCRHHYRQRNHAGSSKADHACCRSPASASSIRESFNRRRDDPLYRARRALLVGEEKLSADAAQRLASLLELGDPGAEVAIAYRVKERLRDFYRAANTEQARQLLDDLQGHCLKVAMPPEVQKLGRTMRTWFTKICNYHLAKMSNGPTESINNLIKRVKRVGFGFRNFENYRIRALLYAGKPNWRVLGSIVVR
jgi:transposase